MKNIIFIIPMILLFSCNLHEGKYIRYSVSGSATDAKVLYLDNGINIEQVIALPWSKDIFISNNIMVGISAFNLSDGEIDGRILFMGNGDWKMYKRQIDENFIMIKGVIHSTL